MSAILEENVRYVKCTFCGWNHSYDASVADNADGAWEKANRHAMECKADPRNAEIAALRERAKVLEGAAAKLVNCHEQDEDGCVHAKDINVAVYDVTRKFDRDKALEDLAFILGAAALRGEA